MASVSAAKIYSHAMAIHYGHASGLLQKITAIPLGLEFTNPMGWQMRIYNVDQGKPILVPLAYMKEFQDIPYHHQPQVETSYVYQVSEWQRRAIHHFTTACRQLGPLITDLEKHAQHVNRLATLMPIANKD